MNRVLLLNASYEPIYVIPMKRAVCLLLEEKADLVQEGEGVVRSSNHSVPMPSVIRLRYYVKIPYRSGMKLTRRNIVLRDNFTCQYCGKYGDTVDHIHPRSKGGQHVWENVVCACKRCNSKKSDRLLSEIGWKLRTSPAVPKYFNVASALGGSRKPEWDSFLTPT